MSLIILDIINGINPQTWRNKDISINSNVYCVLSVQVLTVLAGRGIIKIRDSTWPQERQNMVGKNLWYIYSKKQTLLSALEHEVLKWLIRRMELGKARIKDAGIRVRPWRKNRIAKEEEVLLGGWERLHKVQRWEILKGLDDGKWFLFVWEHLSAGEFRILNFISLSSRGLGSLKSVRKRR